MSLDEQAKRLEIDADFETANEELYRRNLTDGLPVVPPTEERVKAMMTKTDRDPDEVIGVMPPRYGDATVEKIAINAVMAGCKPEYMPVLVAAVAAMCEDKFNLYGINATTHPVAPLLIVNGPIVDDINLNYGYNVFGQGWRSNSTIGRAIRLLLTNVGGGRPGDMDRATHGHPGKFSFCIAENETKSPWESFHVRRGYDSDESTVTVIAAEAPHEVNDHVSEDGGGILTVAADVLATMGHNNAYVTHSEVTVVFGPEHAETISRDSYSVSDVKWFLYDNARNRLGKLKSGGLYGIHDWADRFAAATDDAMIPVVEDPKHVNVLVAGGAGKHSMALPSFGETRSVTKPIARGE
ncbi:hypothetical protein [Natrinema soli]|uniref:Thioredoxin n=1 Tax=Natrinema soli TaxID=1930624 RepID=A0ABD5SIN2_9EURY|nr:hypothetical protein [Natrinema soli]